MVNAEGVRRHGVTTPCGACVRGDTTTCCWEGNGEDGLDPVRGAFPVPDAPTEYAGAVPHRERLGVS